MAEFPALPLWTDAYIADCSHLSFAEHGAYLSLLLIMWRSPECRIPDDDEWIMRKLRCNADAMRTHVRSVMREFCETDAGWVTQKRLRKEWAWCRDKRKKNSEAAKSRWEHDKPSCERTANGHANGYANAMPPSHTLSIPPKERPASRFDDFWEVCPRKIGKDAAEKAWPKALKEADAEILICAMRGFAQKSAVTEERFIPAPATWLVQKRWLDEEGSGAPLTPDQIAANMDRADRLMKRGKYAPVYG